MALRMKSTAGKKTSKAKKKPAAKKSKKAPRRLSGQVKAATRASQPNPTRLVSPRPDGSAKRAQRARSREQRAEEWTSEAMNRAEAAARETGKFTTAVMEAAKHQVASTMDTTAETLLELSQRRGRISRTAKALASRIEQAGFALERMNLNGNGLLSSLSRMTRRFSPMKLIERGRETGRRMQRSAASRA